MNKVIGKLIYLATNQPGKLWAVVMLPFAGIAVAICIWTGSFSILSPDQKGAAQFNKEEYQAAAVTFVDPQWKATALYRTAKFGQAAAIWAGYDTPEGAYNQANSLLMDGKYEDAIKRYDRALELKPDWLEAEENREIAVIRAERVKREGGNSTEGMLGADEISFTKGESSSDSGEETVENSGQLSDAEVRAVWLRNVQTRPSDFLRSKFAYQTTIGSQAEAGEDEAK